MLLLDAGRRRVASEMLRLQEQGIPRREIGPLLESARRTFHPSRILGVSEPMVNLRRRVAKVARGDGNVLVRGAEGTGKELVARALHFGSRRSGAFVPVNCAALAPELLEAELFGQVKGAFDGAISDRPGLFQQAHLGTVFLDEVQELPPELQAKVVRVLAEGEVVRMGSNRVEHVEVRVVAATPQDLEAAVRRGSFREDLYYRLNVVDLALPDLAERPGDVELLAREFLRRFGADRETLTLSDAALRVMERYPWPGNVRELENCIERACAVVEGDLLDIADLPQPLRDLAQTLGDDLQIPAPRPPLPIAGTHSTLTPGRGETQPAAGYGRREEPEEDVPVSLENYERMCLLAALDRTGGDKLAAAKLLNVGKSTLYRKLKAHGIR